MRVCMSLCVCVPTQASEEIRQLQVQSQTMSTKLKNRRATEHKLGNFIEHMTVSERMVNGVLEGEVGSHTHTHTQTHTRAHTGTHSHAVTHTRTHAIDHAVCVLVVQ